MSKCIHSRNCVLHRPDVFVPDVKGEWIHPENASSCELRAIADNCPSGAIRYEETDSAQRKPLVNTLHIRENGPYALNADLQLGEEPCASQKMTLCRCGASKNKPYCDGAHVEMRVKPGLSLSARLKMGQYRLRVIWKFVRARVIR